MLGSGVGITPLLAMLEEQIITNPERPVYWIQSAYDEERLAFKEHEDELLARIPNAKKIVVLSSSQPRIDGEFLAKENPAGSDAYLCGSLDFMTSMIGHFDVLEHQNDLIQYEPFGPKMSTTKV